MAYDYSGLTDEEAANLKAYYDAQQAAYNAAHAGQKSWTEDGTQVWDYSDEDAKFRAQIAEQNAAASKKRIEADTVARTLAEARAAQAGGRQAQGVANLEAMAGGPAATAAARAQAAADRDALLAKAGAARTTGPVGTWAGLQGTAAGGATIAGTETAQAAKDRLALYAATAKGRSGQMGTYLAGQGEAQAQQALVATDYQQQQGLYNEWLRQEAIRQKRLAEASGSEATHQAATESALLAAGAQVVGAAASAYGGKGSDRRMKTDVKPSEADVDALLSALHPYDYKYRDPKVPGAAPGRHTSVMAQDLEKSELGRRFVQKGPDGLRRVDYGAMAPTMLAALARLNERLDAAEGR